MVAIVPAPARSLDAASAWWRYVDRTRAHVVDVEWRETAGELRVIESTPSAPDAHIEDVLRVPEPWEGRVALWLLESRLAQLGEYWRSSPGARGWTRVTQPVGAPVADTRRNGVIDPRVAPFLHHFHSDHGQDQILAGLAAAREDRFLVLRAKVDVSSLEVERLDVIHRELPTTLARSIMLREQIALAQLGHTQLVTRDHYRQAYGDRGEERAARLVLEIAEQARSGEGGRRLAPGEDAFEYAEFLTLLNDPRLLALHRRFLDLDEEDELLRSGPVEIRKAIYAKRRHVESAQKHLLTILEASLLARERMRNGELRGRDPEVRSLTRLAYYL